MKNNKKPLITIVTPTYNSAKYISETILSVKSQTYENWEYIIVDDCSNDNTVNIVESFASNDKRIKLVKLKENCGAAVARNAAIKMAKGRYLSFIDSDDLWSPEKLDIQVKFMMEKNVSFSFTQYRIINEDGTRTKRVVNVPLEIDYKGLLRNTIIGCLTVMIDIKEIKDVQMPNVRTRQDTALWLSILKRGYKAYGIKKELAQYRKVSGSLSSNKFKAAKKTWDLYRNLEKLSIAYSLWCFINYGYNAFKKRFI
ncbi:MULTISPECIES: glycosyltransferase family 2 protein [Heyndrickxia]|uniref:glycosyltransferase family 2 protein n=1 Tax=Heyndrickxia TaxID=2837504 RepID=UPI002DB8D567|nr:glycosyltransferase family 2 protein [Weizmannia sp. CD-2023]MEC2222765.1 glycosyltransferase family 2 protein [Weizmannia sp. CD-2023]